MRPCCGTGIDRPNVRRDTTVMPYGMAGGWDQKVTERSFFTLVTPQADHATYSA
jgi:hypothetical protein